MSCPLQVVQVSQMQWEKPNDLHPDVVLAADVLYDPGQFCLEAMPRNGI